MEFRNPQFNADGTIDCEVNHPVYGWIPFTASATDVEPLGAAVFAAAQGTAAAYVAPPEPDPPTWEELQAAAAQVVHAYLNSTAKAKGYDSALSAVSYETSGNAQWAAEAVAFKTWRDAVWVQVFAYTPETAPATAEALIAALPTLTWPEP